MYFIYSFNSDLLGDPKSDFDISLARFARSELHLSIVRGDILRLEVEIVVIVPVAITF